jgi:hypothetical protein
MAFFITMPADFRIGETCSCRINRKPAQLTWRDKDHLVIEPGDIRRIVYIERSGGLISFACTDADGTPPSIVSEADFSADDNNPQ